MWDSTRGLALLLRHMKERTELESKKILYSRGYGRHLGARVDSYASPRKRIMERGFCPPPPQRKGLWGQNARKPKPRNGQKKKCLPV